MVVGQAWVMSQVPAEGLMRFRFLAKVCRVFVAVASAAPGSAAAASRRVARLWP